MLLHRFNLLHLLIDRPEELVGLMSSSVEVHKPHLLLKLFAPSLQSLGMVIIGIVLDQTLDSLQLPCNVFIVLLVLI